VAEIMVVGDLNPRDRVDLPVAEIMVVGDLNPQDRVDLPVAEIMAVGDLNPQEMDDPVPLMSLDADLNEDLDGMLAGAGIVAHDFLVGGIAERTFRSLSGL
jgi:hypothetical protein